MQIVTERKTVKQKMEMECGLWHFFSSVLEDEAIENATFLIFAPYVVLPLFFGENCCP